MFFVTKYSIFSGGKSVAEKQVRIVLTKNYGIEPKKTIEVRYRLGFNRNIEIKELTKYS